ncbi:MAG: pyridoxamine 5'-phosphate oxidase family protein [Planctomycetota bacterium]
MADRDTLAAAVEMAEGLPHVLVATADEAGLPHVAAAQEIALAQDGTLAVGGWFCPGTVANVEHNPRVAVVIWNPETDQGHQLLGRVERSEQVAMLDGYAPEQEAGPPPPQAERRLVIRVETALRFSHAPHSDVEE